MIDIKKRGGYLLITLISLPFVSNTIKVCGIGVLMSTAS